MRVNSYLCIGITMMLGTASFTRAQAQFQAYPYYYQNNSYSYQVPFYYAPPYYAPAYYGIPNRPLSWSYDPYTSGLGPCPQRRPSDPPCKDTIAPTFGQPSYWPR